MVKRARLELVILLAALSVVPLELRAQLLTYLRGVDETPTLHQDSTAYELEYQQGLYHEFSGSFDYINEGHFTGHHRDGYGIEGWYRFPVLPDRKLSLAIGVGPYYYFDTVTPTSGNSMDLHGVAPLVSLAARGTLGDKFFWMVSVDRINPTTDFKTNLVAIGAGYWLGRDSVAPEKDLPGIFEPDNRPPASDPDEISLYGVLSVINISSNPHAFGASAEYRHRFERHLDGTLTYIYEGDPRVARRTGIAAQVWPVRSAVLGKIEIGAGFGAYVFVDRRREPLPGQAAAPAAAGLVSMMASYDLTPIWFGRFIWDRVVTSYNRDADIWRFGFGRKL